MQNRIFKLATLWIAFVSIFAFAGCALEFADAEDALRAPDPVGIVEVMPGEDWMRVPFDPIAPMPDDDVTPPKTDPNPEFGFGAENRLPDVCGGDLCSVDQFCCAANMQCYPQTCLDCCPAGDHYIEPIPPIGDPPEAPITDFWPGEF